MANIDEKDCFDYEPLTKPTRIRLLRVIENNDNDLLRCELEVFDLDTNDEVPKYAALSYTWGHAQDRVPMICNGKTLQITTKLDEALRKTHVHNPTRYIWVDQVCISQSDLEEKGQQIQLMTAIYQIAWIVLAWLGLPDDTTELAIQQIEKVANTWRTENFDSRSMSVDETSCLPQGEDKLTSAALYESYTDDVDSWLALSLLFDRPWFERVWVVQEIMNVSTWGATRQIEAFVVCGEYKIRWMSVFHAATWIQYARGLGRAPPVHSGLTVDGVDHAAKLHGDGFFIRPAYFATTEGAPRSIGPYNWGVLNTFRNFAARKVTDPRDYVFALFGLTDFAYSQEVPGINNSLLIRSPLIPIDYSLPVQDTFRDFTKALISWYASPSSSDEIGPLDLQEDSVQSPLDILLDARVSASDPGWPSWVPDWRLPKSHNLPPTDASKARPNTEYPRLYEHSDPNCLQVAGVILGEVDWVNDQEHSNQILIDSDPRTLSESIEKRLGATYQHGLGSRKGQILRQQDESESLVLQNPAVNHESTAAAFLWTLSAGIVPQILREAGVSAETYERSDVFYKFLDLLRVHIPQADLFSLGDEKWSFCKPLKDLVNFDSIALFDGQSRARLCCRRIFTTDTGYMGTADPDVRPGNVIALLYGMSMPVVLLPGRTEDGEVFYRLNGGAWVRGVMDGEIIDDMRESGDSPELIVLR